MRAICNGARETKCSLKDTEDSREALLAFVEKREAVYRGR